MRTFVCVCAQVCDIFSYMHVCEVFSLISGKTEVYTWNLAAYIFWDKVCHWTWSIPVSSSLAEHHNLPVSSPPSAGVTGLCVHASCLPAYQGFELRSSYLCATITLLIEQPPQPHVPVLFKNGTLYWNLHCLSKLHQKGAIHFQFR